MTAFILALVLLAPAPAFAELMTIDPADYAEGTVLTSVVPGALVVSPMATAVSFDPDLQLIGRGLQGGGGASCCWMPDDLLRVSFDVPTDFVEVLFIRGISASWTGVGMLSAYDDQDQLLETVITETMDEFDALDARPATVARGSADVSYVLISENHSGDSSPGIRVRMVAFETPEPSTLVLATLVLAAALLSRS